MIQAAIDILRELGLLPWLQAAAVVTVAWALYHGFVKKG